MATKKEKEGSEKEAPKSTRPITFVPDPNDPTKPIRVGPQEVDTEGYEGSYKKIDEPEGSEPYALKVVEDDPYGRTHHLINQEHFWAGTKEDFKKQFEK